MKRRRKPKIYRSAAKQIEKTEVKTVNDKIEKTFYVKENENSTNTTLKSLTLSQNRKPGPPDRLCQLDVVLTSGHEVENMSVYWYQDAPWIDLAKISHRENSDKKICSLINRIVHGEINNKETPFKPKQSKE